MSSSKGVGNVSAALCPKVSEGNRSDDHPDDMYVRRKKRTVAVKSDFTPHDVALVLTLVNYAEGAAR